jgi:hypothetical protein
VALCTAALLANALPASATSQSAPGSTVTVISKVDSLPALPGGIKPALKLPSCIPVINSFDRTHECWVEVLGFLFLQRGVPIGSKQVFLFQYMTLAPKGARWSEKDIVVATITVGKTFPIIADLRASCGAHCTAHADLKGILKIGTHGAVGYSTNVPKDTEITTSTHYTLFFIAPPAININLDIKWHSPWQYRCDNNLAEGGTGCVVPKFTPTLDLSRSRWGAAAAMIAWAQKNLDGHWGLKGEGQPLRRLRNPKFATPAGNRAVICERKWVANPNPWKAGNPPVTIKDSCDEYPFAGTYESGAMPPGHGVPNGAACAQVTAVKTSDTGNNPAKLWNDVNVIGTFSAHDKCVRGHIPLKLNTDLGRDGYLALINSDRLMDQDPFWVKVTS